MTVFRKIFLGLVILFIALQFFRPKKNISTEVSVNKISTLYAVPVEVNTILKKACNDCHSDNTTYPWYNNFQPVAWWLNNHVNDGKRHLNFDEFTNMRVSRQYKRLNDCIEEVKDGGMPLQPYTWIHKSAILTDVEKQTFYDWCNTVRDSIKARYPADSLVSEKKK